MKIEKTPYGKYRIRKMVDGQTLCITFDHKPSKAEIERELLIREMKKVPKCEYSFDKASTNYIEAKTNVLSPTTITNYQSIKRNLSTGFLQTKLCNIDTSTLQIEINAYAEGRGAKSVKNAFSFINAVVKFYIPDATLTATLPQPKKTKLHIPTDEEVKKIFEYSKGSPYEVPLRLAAYGLRKSELLCIDKNCIKGNVLTIDQAKVVNPDKQYIVKTTKTTSSAREIYVDDELAELISYMDQPFEMFPGDILRYLHRAQDVLGIPKFRLHDLRHYYVSMAHEMGIPDIYIAGAVGHASTSTTRKTYLHQLDNKTLEKQQAASLAIAKLSE